MKKTLLLIITSLILYPLFSQNKFSVSGTVADTLGTPLAYSTVLLLKNTDSVLLDYSRTAMDGTFSFKDVNEGKYIIKATYLGFLPVMQNIEVANKNSELGTISLKPIAKELMEVVIKEAKAAIKMKGDTIEYDASTFKVPEGATVEELLRKLPGIQVSNDGSIQAEGKNVNKVTVDGKSFFGSDPKAATKNLPAEGISKVQVFDSTTEEEEATGLKGASEDKTMNLELKEEFKKGGFGKIVAGLGTKNRAEIKGNYNKFNEKIQFSIIAGANNTGRNGLGWNDYRDFMGAQAFNFGGNQFGFGGNGGNVMYFGGGSSIESSIQSSFFNNSTAGLPQNNTTGLSFNYDNKKTKLSAVYFFKQNALTNASKTFNESFFSDFILNENSENEFESRSLANRLELELEQEIDSLHTVKLTMDVAAINEKEDKDETIKLISNNLKSTETLNTNQQNRNGYLGRTALTFNKKFIKKGRRLGTNISYLNTQLKDSIQQDSDLNFYDTFEQVDSIARQNLLNFNDAKKTQVMANAVYVEPFSNKLFLQTFYNFSNRIETGERLVENVTESGSSLNEELSRNFENTIQLNRIGSAIRYLHDGLNISLGLGYQHFKLNGSLENESGLLTNSLINKTFKNVIPFVGLSYQPQRNIRYSLTLKRTAIEPSVNDLQPIVDNSNPLNIRTGNIALLPEVTNRLSLGFSKNWPLQAIRVYYNIELRSIENQFSSQVNIDDNFVRNSIPINVNDGRSIENYINVSFPIVKNKITVSTRGSFDINEKNAIINDEINKTTTHFYSSRINLDIVPNDNIGVYLSARNSLRNTAYAINTAQNQKILNGNYKLVFNAKTFFGIFLNSDFNYTTFKNVQFNYQENLPIFNFSFYKQFLKKKKLELRFSAYDVFNRNRSIDQNTTANSVFTSETSTLSRYFMMSVTYNLLGLKEGIKKSRWW